MLKQYLSRGCTNSLLFGLTSLIGKGVWLLCMPYILSQLSVVEIGLFDLYQSFFLIGSLMISSISAQPLGRFYLKHRDNPALQQQTLSTSIMIVLICTILCIGASAFAMLRYLAYGDSYFVMFLLFNAALFSCFSFVTFFAQIREHLKEYVLLYCAQNFLALGIALFCLRAGCGASSLFWANGLSYLVCVPIFLNLFLERSAFIKEEVYEQLKYGIPLLAYNVVYMLLFAVDRWYLAATYGYEVLGLYAVLWYFGRIFVYATIALYDASPMLFYNAQHEKDGINIISRAIRYVTILYVSGALLVIPCAYIVLNSFLPQYMHLISYVPLFMVPLLLVETGRFWQTGFMLSMQTKWIPLICLITLCVQSVGLYVLGDLGIGGVCGANGVAFSFFMLLNGIGSTRIYNSALFEVRQLFTLFLLYALYTLFLWYALHVYKPLFLMIAILFSWPFALWFSGVIKDDEKVNILQICKKIVSLA